MVCFNGAYILGGKYKYLTGKKANICQMMLSAMKKKLVKLGK